MHIVPDVGVLTDGSISDGLSDGQFENATVTVPEAVVAELESRANDDLDAGWDGLDELQRLAEHSDRGDIDLEYAGEQSSTEDDISTAVRDLAEERTATVVTNDAVQRETSRAKGLDVEYISTEVDVTDTLAVEEYFDDRTMSVHLKTDTVPKAKRGTIGDMQYEAVADEPLDEETMDSHTDEILEATKQTSNGFVELSEPGMQIVQYHDYRIAIATPPFSDGIEITAVRPIAQTDIDDYDHADQLTGRLDERHRGVLISGSPGAGKSTFAQAVARYLDANDHAVKTMEKPRDLQVGPDITQYTELGGEMAKTADALLMVRPDYTVYDEVRKTDDFEVFADMRLAGVGMIGVVHATRPIDALQRLVGRVELGMIPQVVDTVVYIDAGQVDTVFDVETAVKVPAGLNEEDLARPVIVVSDAETGTPAYEIYTFNRQVVTVPLDDEQGEVGSQTSARGAKGTPVTPEITSNHINIPVDSSRGATVQVLIDGEYVFTGTVGHDGEIQVSRGSAIANDLEAAIDRNRTVRVLTSSSS